MWQTAIGNDISDYLTVAEKAVSKAQLLFQISQSQVKTVANTKCVNE